MTGLQREEGGGCGNLIPVLFDICLVCVAFFLSLAWDNNKIFSRIVIMTRIYVMSYKPSRKSLEC